MGKKYLELFEVATLLRDSGVTMVTGGGCDQSKSTIHNASSSMAWPVAAFFRYRLQSKKNCLNDIFRA